MRAFVCVGLVCLSALGLAGCIKVEVDESSAFRPKPPAISAATAADLKLNHEERLKGVEISHQFIPLEGIGRVAVTLVEHEDAQESRPLIVHCGGNASDRYRDGEYYAAKALPYGDVLLFDYPGYGDSDGEATGQSLHDAAALISDLSSGLAGDDRPLVLWGHSLGGFVCSQIVAMSPQVDAMIYETSARNAYEVAQAWKPWYLPFVQPAVNDGLGRFDNVDALAGFSGKVLVLGATDDRTLPVKLSNSLFGDLHEAGLDAAYHVFAANHSNVPDSEEFDDVMAPFFAGISSGP